jgi:hypothetical protein
MAGDSAHLVVILGINFLTILQFCLQTKLLLARYRRDFVVNVFCSLAAVMWGCVLLRCCPVLWADWR